MVILRLYSPKAKLHMNILVSMDVLKSANTLAANSSKKILVTESGSKIHQRIKKKKNRDRR